VPLAPLTNVPESEEALRGLVRRMAERINAEPQPRAAKLWTATCLLMGLRFSEELAFQSLEGVQNMRESTTYQAILREGRQEGKVEGEQELLLRQGTKRFGEPDAATIAALEAIQDIDRLGALGERILDPNIQGRRPDCNPPKPRMSLPVFPSLCPPSISGSKLQPRSG
jgi:predicted transposase YdaD